MFCKTSNSDLARYGPAIQTNFIGSLLPLIAAWFTLVRLPTVLPPGFEPGKRFLASRPQAGSGCQFRHGSKRKAGNEERTWWWPSPAFCLTPVGVVLRYRRSPSVFLPFGELRLANESLGYMKAVALNAATAFAFYVNAIRHHFARQRSGSRWRTPHRGSCRALRRLIRVL